MYYGLPFRLLETRELKSYTSIRWQSIPYQLLRWGGGGGDNSEEISSFLYVLPLVDKNCKIVPIYAYGVDTISSGINEVDMTNVAYLFGKYK